MKKVMKVRYNGKNVVFENIVEAYAFMKDLEIKETPAECYEEMMTVEAYNLLKESDGECDQ